MNNNGNDFHKFDPNYYQAPFPWFGGKSRAAGLIWERLGDVTNYIEPFFGSGAALFLRPHYPFEATRIETINDKNGYVANFWRSLKSDPAAVAHYADWPQNENDLHARHYWLKQQSADLDRRLEGDTDYYDAKIAGLWVWGMCLWIGNGFCDLDVNGPWSVVNRQLLHLGNAGRGINRKLLHLGDAGRGINRQLLHLGSAGMGINRKRPSLGSNGRGLGKHTDLYTYFDSIAERLRQVRVCSGDWLRVLGPTPTEKLGLTGILLDPPYNTDAGRDNKLYATEDTEVSHAVREWAIANGNSPLLRICLCGYEGEHTMPASWAAVKWKTGGGYSNQGNGDNQNAAKERLWFSPYCLKPETVRQLELI